VTARIAGSTFDCADALRLGSFWSELLDRGLAPWSSEDGALVDDPSGHEPWIGLARVSEGKVAKNRCHMDLSFPDLEAAIARCEALGGRTIAAHRESYWSWNVMADPEGNEFCVGGILAPGASGGWAFDCADPRADMGFWAGLLDFDTRSESDDGVLLVERAEPWHWIWLAKVPEPKTAKNRFHLDLETDDLEEELERAERLDGRTIAAHRTDAWDWNVVADPEGNELCLGRTRAAPPAQQA
jgi:predicted enzyme related to lactoylglutathione lyase